MPPIPSRHSGNAKKGTFLVGVSVLCGGSWLPVFPGGFSTVFLSWLPGLQGSFVFWLIMEGRLEEVWGLLFVLTFYHGKLKAYQKWGVE